MEMEIYELIQELSQYKCTHPNISLLWENYMTIKLKGMRDAITDCKDMIDKMENTHYISSADILSLYNIFNPSATVPHN